MVMTVERDSDYLTPEEIAQQLRVNLRTVYRLVERGELRALRVGKLYRIPRASFEAFLASGDTSSH